MSKQKKSSRRQLFIQGSRLWLFAIGLTLSLTAVLSFNLNVSNRVSVEVGKFVVNDIIAPRSLTYTSDVLTARAREQASQSVQDVYTTIDVEIGRGQLNLNQLIFSFIDVVRADTQATQETKLTYLKAIESLSIEDEIGRAAIELGSADYEAVESEIARIIGELMREDIKESQVSEYRRRAGREVRLDLTPTQTNIVVSLAPQLIVPNIFYDAEATEAMRAAAVAAVAPQVRVIAENQPVLRSGDTVHEEDVEALKQLGLLETETNWRDVVTVFMLSLLCVAMLTLHWQQYHRKLWAENGRYLLALFGIFTFFAIFARVLLLSGIPVLVYWFPIAAMSMLFTVIYDVRLSILATLIMAAIYGFIAPNSLELALYTAVGGILATLTLHDAQRINAFFRAGLVAALGHMLVILIFRFSQDTVEPVLVSQLLLYGVANGVLSAALTLVGFFVMGSLFGVTTTLQLQDLARLDHPLLQELLRRAPGTYHHSIMVANLAEQAAEEIKANSALIRVGAFYHDIGKMNRPPFFTENQEGVNPHDAMDPFTSARIILSHVTDGLELARRYKLPDQIRAFIAEHHGTRIVKSFYFKAREEAGEDADDVNEEQFRYPGPRPRTPETGVVLMADAIESASRALQPDTPKAIEKLVNSLIDDDITEGQLDESGLTMGDIQKVRASFIKTLKGRFHVRVKYPGNEALMVQSNQLPAAANTAENSSVIQPATQETAVFSPSTEESSG